MTTHSKNRQPISDIAVFNIGIILGGGLALLSLWLWLTYQPHNISGLFGEFSQQALALIPPVLQNSLSQEANLMGLPLVGETSAFWYMSRSSGVIAYLLLWASTCWGIMMSSKIVKGIVSAPLVFSFHEFLPILAIGFSTFHAVVLLGDRYIEFNLLHLLIPFTSTYEPLWTGLGTVAFYLMMLVTVSTYLKKHIGRTMWRYIHSLAYGGFVLAFVHSLMVGSDSHTPFMLILYVTTGLSLFFLTVYRLLSLR